MVKSTLGRIGHILSSSVNDALDRLEDPEKQVRQLIRDMEAAIEDAIRSVSTAVADERRLARRCEEDERQVKKLDKLARRAIESGDESLARAMTVRRLAYEQASAVDALGESRDTVTRLKTQLTEMRCNLQQARDRQGSLIARIRAARSMPGWSTTATAQKEDPYADFQRLACKLDRSREELEHLRAEVEIFEETKVGIEEEQTGTGAAFERQVRDLELKRRIDEEMDLLRQKVGT